MGGLFLWICAIISVYVYCDAATFYHKHDIKKIEVIAVKSRAEATGDFYTESYEDYYFSDSQFVSSNHVRGIKEGDSVYLLFNKALDKNIIWNNEKISFNDIINYNTVGVRALIVAFPYLIFMWCITLFLYAAGEMQKKYSSQLSSSKSKFIKFISILKFHVPLLITLLFVGFPLFSFVNFVKNSEFDDKYIFSFLSGTGYMLLITITSALTNTLYDLKYTKDEKIVTIRDTIKIVASCMTLITISGYFTKIATNGRINIFKVLWDIVKAIT